jgi:AcrR family transcriptional regulator
MSSESATRAALLQAARELFALHGYDGASVRAITGRAGVNLGAVAYHFGSKQALFESVTGAVARSARERIVEAAKSNGAPLERIEAVVRAFFAHLYENPEVPRLVIHTVFSRDTMPEAGRGVMGANLRTLAELIMEGQADGSIRPGDPELMALSVASQPLWMVFARRPLREGASLDQDDPNVRGRLTESVVDFVKAGLASDREADNGSPM